MKHPDIVARMRAGYEQWFRDVSAARNYAPPRIYLGTKFENPTTLTRQDWRGPRASWGEDGLGYWEVDVRSAGKYDVTLRMPAAPGGGTAVFRLNGVEERRPVAAGATECRVAGVVLHTGAGRLEAILDLGGKAVGVHYVDVKRL